MEKKSEWGARRNIVWTGLVWDTVNFKLWVTEEKLVKAELLLEDLWKEMSERAGWQCSGRIERRVLDEILFWVKNLRSLNGWPMRDTEEVVYCKEGCVDMFSDASDFQLA